MRSRSGGSSAATCCTLRAEKSLIAMHRPELRPSSCLMIFLRSEFGHQLIQKTSLPGKQLGFGNLNWEPATAIDFGEFLHYPGLFGVMQEFPEIDRGGWNS